MICSNVLPLCTAPALRYQVMVFEDLRPLDQNFEIPVCEVPEKMETHGHLLHDRYHTGSAKRTPCSMKELMIAMLFSLSDCRSALCQS